jgi:16S rRNA C967 or C1407 C5-methylase (RsmB/RsmF family)/NOL1/NOP2/fmu family ribosome biogenesis protein
MVNLSANFSARMRRLLGETDWRAFSDALQQPAPVSVRYNRHKSPAPQVSEAVSWCAWGKYLTQRPVFTLDPLLHAGAYYVQEASSMCLEQTAALWRDKTRLRVLDLCAAPGGKSTHLADLLPADSLLVSNEVIYSRTGALMENLSKWGNPNVVITQHDPADFAALPGFFDVMLIDAPCSGEGLFRKDPASVDEWSEEHVTLCAERQRRIVTAAWNALKNGGLLLYSTCTYNEEENEHNVRWIRQHLGAEVVTLPLQSAWHITSNEYGHRFFPHKTKGEGFFLSLLRKTQPTPAAGRAGRTPKPNILKRPPAWLHGDFTFIREGLNVQALPSPLAQDMLFLKQHLRVLQAGVRTGEIKGNDMAPSAPLALSTALRREAFLSEEVDLNTALHFLRRDAVTLPHLPRGFVLLLYQNFPLGFVKNLGTRSNNLYPPGWRVRMNIW